MPRAGDIVVVSDGGQKTLAKDLLVPFSEKVNKNTQVPAFVRYVNLNISEESIRARKKRVRGDISQVQQATFVTSKQMAQMVPEIAHAHYPGTNRGDSVAWVVLNSQASLWEASVEQKRKIYGTRMTAGGVTSADTDPRTARKDTDVEPVFYCCLPETYFSDLIQCHNALAFLDLTPGQGEAAKACLTLKKPYLGFCMTDEHMEALHKVLVEWLLAQMKTEGHQLYVQKYAEGAMMENKAKEKEKKENKEKAAHVKENKQRKEKREHSPAASESASSSSTDGGKKKKKKKKKKKSSRGKKQRCKKASDSDADTMSEA